MKLCEVNIIRFAMILPRRELIVGFNSTAGKISLLPMVSVLLDPGRFPTLDSKCPFSWLYNYLWPMTAVSKVLLFLFILFLYIYVLTLF